jgi:hypothetical protein
MTIALSFFSKILKKYFNEVMEIKRTKLMSKCDLSREERIKKYDILLGHYSKLQMSKMYSHLKNRYPDEFKTIIDELETQLKMILSVNS